MLTATPISLTNDIDINDLRTLLNDGCVLSLSRPAIKAPAKMQFSFKVLLAPCTLPADDGSMTVSIHCNEDMTCRLHCYVSEALNASIVSNTVKHLFAKDEYDEFCDYQLAQAQLMGLATEDAYLKGSIFFLRGKGLHLSAVFNIIAAFQESYWARVQNFFCRCKDSTPEGLAKFCRAYYNSTKQC